MDELISTVSSGLMLANLLHDHSVTQPNTTTPVVSGCMTFNKTSNFYSGNTEGMQALMKRGVLYLDLTGFAVVKELSLAAFVSPLLSVCKSKSTVDLSLSGRSSTSAKLETRCFRAAF